MQGAYKYANFNYLELAALNCQEAVARILINCETGWKVTTLRALVLGEVVDSLLLAAAKSYFLRVQVIRYAFRIRVLVCHIRISPL
jgi:hypothetical protein